LDYANWLTYCLTCYSIGSTPEVQRSYLIKKEEKRKWQRKA
jgi:hypothetical protein